MEDSRMEKILQNEKSEAHLTSAAAFVEGGIQESCDDACSICLEAFCENDPSTVTTCKHEFHLQCILEWCQRSSQCPMCWQPISLKDPTGQELLEGIEHERSFRTNRPRNATIFHHPALGDFELQHLPVGATDAELEERIIQHLAAAAAMGRTRHISRREGQRNRLSSQGRPHFVVFSTHPSGPTSGSGASSPAETDGGDLVPDLTPSSPPFPVRDSMLIAPTNSTEEDQGFSTPTRSSSSPVNSRGSPSSNRRSASNSSSPGQDQGGPSDLQSLSESVKSRFNAVSMRCKESITKSTRGWKERLFSQKPSMADISSEVRKEVTAGIATVSRMMERLEARESKGTASSSSSSSVVSSSRSSENVPVPTTPDNVSTPETDKGNQQRGETTTPNHHPTSSCATSSCSTET